MGKKYSAEAEAAAGRMTHKTAPAETRAIIYDLNLGAARLIDRTQTKKHYLMPQGLAEMLGIALATPKGDPMPTEPPDLVLTTIHDTLQGITDFWEHFKEEPYPARRALEAIHERLAERQASPNITEVV